MNTKNFHFLVDTAASFRYNIDKELTLPRKYTEGRCGPMGKFVIKRSKNDGYVFNLKAGNGEVIATSEVYNSESACLNGIESVRKNAVEGKLEDQTVENFEQLTNPKFEVYQDKAGEFRFRLKARNGEIIAVGEGYKAKASCLNGIESIRKNAPDAEIDKEY